MVVTLEAGGKQPLEVAGLGSAQALSNPGDVLQRGRQLGIAAFRPPAPLLPSVGAWPDGARSRCLGS